MCSRPPIVLPGCRAVCLGGFMHDNFYVFDVCMHVCVLHVGGKGYSGLQRKDFFGGLQESAL